MDAVLLRPCSAQGSWAIQAVPGVCVGGGAESHLVVLRTLGLPPVMLWDHVVLGIKNPNRCAISRPQKHGFNHLLFIVDRVACL